MPLKLEKQKSSTLLKLNVQSVNEVSKVPFETTDFFALVQVIANMFDDISQGEDMYMILGATSKRDAFTCAIKLDGAATTIYGSSLEDLAAKLADLL